MEQQEDILSNKEHITTNNEQLNTLQKAVEQEQKIHAIEKEQEQIKTIKEEIAQIPPVQKESNTKKGFSIEVPKVVRKTLLTGLFGLSSFFASAKNEKNGTSNEESKNIKKEASIKIAKEMESVKGLHFYKGGTEKTPTGQDNSFENNPYHVTTEDVYKVAKEYGFNTENNLSLQKDMYTYLEQHRPDILKKMHEAYGQTNAETFDDGILGSRTAFVMNQLNTISQLTPETKPEKTVEIKTSIEKTPRAALDSSFYVNIRGDENDHAGTYYVVKDAATLQKLEDLLPGTFSSAEYQKQYGTLTANMRKDVFFTYHANSEEIKQLLGKAWHRDPKNPMYITQDIDASVPVNQNDIVAK
ncbi:MAG: hypothetical protein WCQ32_00755 [bacterium]